MSDEYCIRGSMRRRCAFWTTMCDHSILHLFYNTCTWNPNCCLTFTHFPSSKLSWKISHTLDLIMAKAFTLVVKALLGGKTLSTAKSWSSDTDFLFFKVTINDNHTTILHHERLRIKANSSLQSISCSGRVKCDSKEGISLPHMESTTQQNWSNTHRAVWPGFGRPHLTQHSTSSSPPA